MIIRKLQMKNCRNEARWGRVLNPAFGGRIPDFRKRERCAYDAGTIAWTILLGMFLRREAVGDLAWAKDVTLGEVKGVVSFNVVRCAERAKGDGVSRPGVRRERINDKPPYRGCFATNFDVWDADSVPTRYMRRDGLIAGKGGHAIAMRFGNPPATTGGKGGFALFALCAPPRDTSQHPDGRDEARPSPSFVISARVATAYCVICADLV
jgi:hypothetical protein